MTSDEDDEDDVDDGDNEEAEDDGVVDAGIVVGCIDEPGVSASPLTIGMPPLV